MAYRLRISFQPHAEQIRHSFYNLFGGIVKYLADYLEFIDKLKSGIFIQYTTDSVLQDVDGRQLMVGHS